ncbi:MAG: polysaccharide deacetylase family protein, partial [Cyanothece sp. SIO1E1]|nr:polysaccharide deacetylase family protein [Cyanothece sp. SIO1E1]
MPNLWLLIRAANHRKAYPNWLKLTLGSSLFTPLLSCLWLHSLQTKEIGLPTSNAHSAPAIAAAIPPALPGSLSDDATAIASDATSNLCKGIQPVSLQLASDWLPLLNWVTQPEVELGEAIGNIGRQVLVQSSSVTWPEIHQQAQLAKVPVIMYHDILPEIQVFFDVTPEELEADFQLIKANGLTPISLDQLVVHLRTGLQLPDKPILLTFDDGYRGHYEYVYPLLKKYGYPATFSIFTAKVDGDIIGRSTVTWSQLRTMAADPLVTIAAHSITHPRDLTTLPDEELEQEVTTSKQILETRLGIPIRYFTYPEGRHDEQVMETTQDAGYQAALAMDNDGEQFAGESKSLLSITRLGQSQLERV